MHHISHEIDTTFLQQHAETIAVVEYHLPDPDPLVTHQLYQTLHDHALDVFGGTTRLVASFGDIALVSEYKTTPEFVYDTTFTDQATGFAGRFSGLCSVFLDNPVPVDETSQTHIVPALEFNVEEVDVEEILSGAALLYPKVAVPLLGNLSVFYRVSGHF